MDWKYLFTSFEGRIGRQQWWLGYLAAIAALVIVMLFLRTTYGDVLGYGAPEDDSSVPVVAAIIMVVCYLAFTYASLALSAKRWHDRGKSAWWILVGFIPVIGGFWVLIENGFLRGTDGPNPYGPDPLKG